MPLSKLLITLILLFHLSAFAAPSVFDSEEMKQVPVLYKGRYRPMEAYARLWLYEISHKEQFTSADAKKFNATSAIDLLWKMNFFGHEPWDEMPLFWIDSTSLINTLKLDSNTRRFSFSELNQKIYENKESNLAFIQLLMQSAFAESYLDTSRRIRSEKIELSSLAPGLWVALNKEDILVTAVPQGELWRFLKAEDRIGSIHDLGAMKALKGTSQDALALIEHLQHFASFVPKSPNEQAYEQAYQTLSSKTPQQELSQTLAIEFPLRERLEAIGDWLRVLPCKNPPGFWVGPQALRMTSPSNSSLIPIGNFTLYRSADFEKIRQSYDRLEIAVHTMGHDAKQQASELATNLLSAYTTLAGKEQLKASEKTLYYPTLMQLKVEVLSYQLPLIEIALTAYVLAACILTIAFYKRKKNLERWGGLLLAFGFIIHTLAIALRCYVLNRPPVSNMFESVIYVPWMTIFAAFILRIFFKSNLLLLAASSAASILLIVLYATGLNRGMENVQAVLDSQYWLIIHVLMVVGSYGLYVLAGILAHLYLAGLMFRKKETPLLAGFSKLILQSMYAGTALLIPGTILGGVWAAESWGRFWDWDPKEAWAFISSCVYLIWIHAYRFRLIRQFGLAVGAITGLMAISFTWYGVNYILGTGLHSYGFGHGGENYYYLFLFVEMLFISVALLNKRKFLRV